MPADRMMREFEVSVRSEWRRSSSSVALREIARLVREWENALSRDDNTLIRRIIAICEAQGL